jgi:hypothetical protein
MTNKLDFQALEDKVAGEDTNWKSRDPNPVVQMSLRMHEKTYGVFRHMCSTERRTNGDMLEVLMKFYVENQPENSASRK